MRNVPHSCLAALAIILIVHCGAAAQTTARLQAEKLFIEAQKALTRGDSESAESLLTKALEKDPGFSSAIWQLAQIYESRGQLAHARELILRGLTLEPKASWARDKLSQLEKQLTGKLLSEAEAYMRDGTYDLAIPKLSLYLGIKPYDPEPLIKLGRCHLALGNLDTAQEYLVQAFERDPTNGQVTALLSEIEERIEGGSIDALVERAGRILADYSPAREAEARAALEAILAKRSDHVWAREKMREIELLSAQQEPPAAPAGKPLERGIETVRTMRDPLMRAWRFIDDKLYVLLAVIALLGVIRLRRRMEKRTHPLQGSLSFVPVLDIVSLLNGNLKTGRLIVVSGDSRGEIFLDRGEIVHAQWKGTDGKTAFHSIISLKSGRYFFRNRLPSIRPTIAEPLSLLLLSLKTKEESNRSGERTREKRQAVTSIP
jgi:tetratricopeptide (TPR) repeat protein